MKRELLELRLVESGNKNFRALVRALDGEQVERFGESARKYQPSGEEEAFERACLLIREGRAVACGAFRKLDGETAELKRIYVRPDCRRRGYARQMVEQLELQALFGGYLRMAVATGRKMPEALALYAGLGYREAPAWGDFVGDRACVCMAKELE